MTDNHVADICAKLAEAHAEDERVFKDFNESDAPPNSTEYKTQRDHLTLTAGRILGRREALNVLTGESIEPNAETAIYRHMRAKG